jgi:hypothetical protein
MASDWRATSGSALLRPSRVQALQIEVRMTPASVSATISSTSVTPACAARGAMLHGEWTWPLSISRVMVGELRLPSALSTCTCSVLAIDGLPSGAKLKLAAC